MVAEESLIKLPSDECHGRTDDKSTLVQVMAWCRQATSHYLSQCWPRYLSSYGMTRPQWVNSVTPEQNGRKLQIRTANITFSWIEFFFNSIFSSKFKFYWNVFQCFSLVINKSALINWYMQTLRKLLDLYRTGGPVATWKIQVLPVLQNFYRT